MSTLLAAHVLANSSAACWDSRQGSLVMQSDVIEVQFVFNAEDNTPEGIKKRKEEARKWIEEWRDSQK